MSHKIAIGVTALFILSACQHTSAPAPAKLTQSEDEIASCLRTVMALDEGRWAYMGTIATLSGKFRTYATTSVHSATGADTWSSKSFGGDVGGDEETAEIGYVKLIGASIVPIEDDAPNHNAAIKYTSCVGPDAEGRYEANLVYKLPNKDGTYDIANNVSWYSEHGSYFVEDISNDKGRIVARRSGINSPAKP